MTEVIPGRLRAQWRQIDLENREAIAVRREWMSLMGLDEEEIKEACELSFDLNLADELNELSAVMGLAGLSKRLGL